ncbi:lyase family protein [Microbacterium hominis]|uniref:lyase family protein n=1 Tax=Microbacterium hominis TaxID=162426 RepID=UPI0020B68915|nr:lyase family protein [Microbacterium hominis]
MPSDPAPIDVGLLSPVTVGSADAVSDAAVLDALVTAEAALARAWGEVAAAPADAVAGISGALGWSGPGQLCIGHGADLGALAEAAVAGGNPVIPLVSALRARVAPEHRAWVHRGATSQDILDSALMLVARRACTDVSAALERAEAALTALARTHRGTVAAARTLGQHAVPTTFGLRAATWLAGVRRAGVRLEAAASTLPAQLGGAAGTLAAAVEAAGHALGDEAARDAAVRLPTLLAAELGLAAPDAPWHTVRWPVTELGDALVQVMDAAGVVAADVVTLSRTEIAEVSEGAAGGSSAMPQKQNPAASVLIRSAAIRAPHLGASLHASAALAVDERPDGAWHAEWPVLRELLRLALGTAATLARLVDGLVIDADAMARNTAASGGLIVAERLSAVAAPLVGPDRLAAIIARANGGDDLRGLLASESALAGLDLDELLDPAHYTGLAGILTDRLTGDTRA